MADINTVITKIGAAMDEACAVVGTPTPSQQLAALQTKYDNYVAAVRAAAQADKDKDDASEAGAGVLSIPA